MPYPSGWRLVELPDRGSTYACDIPGPSRRAPTVVLLHGLIATGLLNWGPYLEPLSRRFRVVVLDHRGHGRGLRHEDPFTLEDCADDVVALADALGVGRFIAVGYSMGGPIAQLVWQRHRQRVEGLVFCATAADLMATSPERVVVPFLGVVDRAARLVPPVVREPALRLLVQGRMPDPAIRQMLLDDIKAHDQTAIRHATRATLTFSSTSWISDVDVPTAVVVTEKDRAVLPSRQRQLAHLIAGAEIIGIPADHGCFAQPDVFGPALLTACEQVAARVAPVRWWPRLLARRAGGPAARPDQRERQERRARHDRRERRTRSGPPAR